MQTDIPFFSCYKQDREVKAFMSCCCSQNTLSEQKACAIHDSFLVLKKESPAQFYYSQICSIYSHPNMQVNLGNHLKCQGPCLVFHSIGEKKSSHRCFKLERLLSALAPHFSYIKTIIAKLSTQDCL